MTKTLTYDEAVSLLDRAVAEKGADYVYPDDEKQGNKFGFPQCQYRTEDDKPSCIIGYVGNYLGVLDQFSEGEPGVSVLRDAGYTFDYRTDDLLNEAQSQQDAGMPWGKSVDAAKAFAESTTP
jgi:hypothetical protein